MVPTHMLVKLEKDHSCGRRRCSCLLYLSPPPPSSPLSLTPFFLYLLIIAVFSFYINSQVFDYDSVCE